MYILSTGCGARSRKTCRREARFTANAKRRDDEAAREKRAAVRVQKIISTALDRPRKTLPGLHDLIERLEAAYDLAMATNQAKSAIDATMATGRLLGLVIDKSAVAIGDLREKPKTWEETIEEMRNNIGDKRTEIFLEAMEEADEKIRALNPGSFHDRHGYHGRHGHGDDDSDDDVIEHRRLGNGSANGDGDE